MAEICPVCRYTPRSHVGPGIPISLPGTVHHRTCATIPQLTPTENSELRKALKEIAEAERQAWADARDIVLW